LERNIIVRVAPATAARATAPTLGRGLRHAAIPPALTAPTTPVQHGEFAAETLKDHLGCIALLARLVGPFAGLQLPLDIDLAALFQIFFDDVDQPLVEYGHAVPFRLFPALAAVLVFPVFRGRQRQIGHL